MASMVGHGAGSVVAGVVAAVLGGTTTAVDAVVPGSSSVAGAVPGTVPATSSTTVPGTVPEASLLPEMAGYDATYYGYIWTRVWALDMASAFQKDGLLNPEVGMRYRRTVLEPGASAEPEALLQSFLGRPPRADAFYQELGLPPPSAPQAR
jgi:hypothetical protein